MKTVGSRAEVWHGTAKKTSGGLLKKDLKKNKRGRIVSKKMSNRAKKEKRLEKAGYKTKKGVFKKFKAKKKGGMNGNNGKKGKKTRDRVKPVLESNENYAKRMAVRMFKEEENKYKLKGHLPKNALQNRSLRSLIRHYSKSPRNAARAMAMSKELKYYEHNFNKNLTEILNKHGNIDKALMESVKNRNEREVRILLNAGANPNVKDIKGKAALYWAVQAGRTDIVELLLDAGADTDVWIDIGWTPLHWVAQNGNTDIVKLLLDAGAEKDVKDRNGQTPLHWAALKGYTAVVKLLLDSGADKETKDNYGWNPLDVADMMGQTDIVKLLKSHHKSKGGSKKRRKRKTTKRKSKK